MEFRESFRLFICEEYGFESENLHKFVLTEKYINLTKSFDYELSEFSKEMFEITKNIII